MAKNEICCDMRGFLSLLILWLLSKRQMSGADIADEIDKRKGCRPNPGTIYPALKSLLAKKAITVAGTNGREKIYSLTSLGKKDLETAICSFQRIFDGMI